MITKNPKSNFRNGKALLSSLKINKGEKSEINLYLCSVNAEVSHFNIFTCFHGALRQANRLFNHSIFFIDDIFHQITCGIITC
jgi:hypothetical protein